MKVNSQKIGYRIRVIRNRREWRQDELADKIGKSTTYIGMIERGERLPTLDTFVDILTALEVTADELLCDVVAYGYQTRLMQYDKRIKQLNQTDREKLYKIIDVYLGDV